MLALMPELIKMYNLGKDEDYCKQYNVKLDLLTYALSLYDFETIKIIILVVLKIIKDTKRFD